MGLEVKQFGGKWRIKVNEEWEFKDKKEMQGCLENLVDYKDKHGQIKSDKF